MTFLKPVSFLIYFLKLSLCQDVPIVNVKQGSISGLASDAGDYYMYLGIPFGAVDNQNPFGPSAPAAPFEGIFNATDDSAHCPQGSVSDTLDCLHLNVFVPSRTDTETLLPVLIFLHGGGFILGSFGREIYGAKYLVRHDIILVTFNYRLGAYGYMCTDNPRVPGNQASRDQLLALEWINENIRSFGGDPDKVTFSGNSAGGMMIDLMISSDNGPKYFQQVILQSGVAFFPSYPATVRDSPLILAEHFGYQTNDIDEALDFLASKDQFDIITASQELGLQFRPCIERIFDGINPFMTENWLTKEIVNSKDLKMIIGFNENEALGVTLHPGSDLTNVVEDALRSTFVIDHEDFQGQSTVSHFFFGDEALDENMFKEAVDLRSDISFVHHSIRSLDRHIKSEVEKVYLYLFSYDGERNIYKETVNITLAGAAHADEIGYLYDLAQFGEPNLKDQLVIDRMTKMWTSFVKHGDPAPEVTELLPVIWQPITSTSPYHYIHIDSELQVSTRPYNERMAFWDLFLELNGHLQRFILDNADL